MAKELEKPRRVVIYTSDVQALTGKSAKGSRNMLTKLRKALGKKPRDLVTYLDFARFYRWEEELVRECMVIRFTGLVLCTAALLIFENDILLLMNLYFCWLHLKDWKMYREMLRGKTSGSSS